MQAKIKNKTAALPHNIVNKTSIYLAKQSKVERNDFFGFEAVIDLPNNVRIIIQSSIILSPQDGKIFEYVLAQWQATKKKNHDLMHIKVDIKEILEAFGWQNRTDNRKKIIQYLNNLIKVTITYIDDENKIMFHMLEEVRIIDSTKTVAVKVSQSYEDALLSAGERYINVSDIMHLKSKYTLEISRYLKIKGEGVSQFRSKLKKEVKHSELCAFLHLDYKEKSSKDKISRAFRELNEKVKYPKYSFNNRIEYWVRKDN